MTRTSTHPNMNRMKLHYENAMLILHGNRNNVDKLHGNRNNNSKSTHLSVSQPSCSIDFDPRLRLTEHTSATGICNDAVKIMEGYYPNGPKNP